MRFFLLAALFTVVLIGLFYALDPSKGHITQRPLLSAKEKQTLSKLPKP